MDFKQFFERYYNTLLKHQTQLSYEFGFSCESIREIKKYLEVSDNLISYSFTTLNFYIDKKFLPSHSIPKKFEYLQITLSIDDEIKINRVKDHSIQDPINKLGKFNIILECDRNHYTSSWHLDRHSPNEIEGTPSNLHPIYHLTFGGYNMEKHIEDDPDVFGRSLILRTPRIMHPPMELILGIDFVFSHFIPKDKIALLSDSTYLELINELKKYLWLPYALAIAKNYCGKISIDNKPCTFDDTFVNSILG